MTTQVRIEVSRKTFPASANGMPLTVLAGLSLTLDAGEFVCLVGPSGCGKSTLLNIVAGLDCSFEGSVEFGDSTEPHRVGHVFQEPRLLPWRTVRQNIELALPAEDADTDLVDHLLDVMELSAFQHQYPERLSLGMSRRVALVRAFAIKPTLLIMDEPFVSLDAPIARRIREQLVRVWHERPHTVLFVTHDLREAIALADRLAFLCAPPARVVAEVQVDLPRDDRGRESAIEAFRKRLTADHPDVARLV
ncbi:ABC transporter ATP-binding protein [Methylolobus aquaticus]